MDMRMEWAPAERAGTAMSPGDEVVALIQMSWRLPLTHSEAADVNTASRIACSPHRTSVLVARQILSRVIARHRRAD
jgi:hypothetical protein